MASISEAFSTFETPVNAVLALLICYYVQSILVPSTAQPKQTPHEHSQSYNWLPKSHPPTVVFTRFTPKTLKPFNGVENKRILLAINGTVFDVSAGANFYGPDGMYGNFAGRDASRGMAKQSFDLEMLKPIDQPLDKLEDLTREEIDNMRGWIEHFTGKYIVCGELVENDA